MPFLEEMPDCESDHHPVVQEAIFSSYIFSLMNFPDDEKKRALFADSVFANNLSNDIADDEELSLPGKIIKVICAARPIESFLGEGASRYIFRSADNGRSCYTESYLVALMIWIPVIGYLGFEARIGREVSYEIIENMLTKQKYKGSSKRTLQDLWKKYKNVSHFWAVFFLSNFEKFDIRFLHTAERIRVLCETYKPDKAKDYLLDSDCTWKTELDINQSSLAISRKFFVDNLPEVCELVSDHLKKRASISHGAN